MQYRVMRRYRGMGQAWELGQVVEMEPRLAEAYNRDSPGLLTPIATTDAPPQDRMLRAPMRRRKDSGNGE